MKHTKKKPNRRERGDFRWGIVQIRKFHLTSRTGWSFIIFELYTDTSCVGCWNRTKLKLKNKIIWFYGNRLQHNWNENNNTGKLEIAKYKFFTTREKHKNIMEIIKISLNNINNYPQCMYNNHGQFVQNFTSRGFRVSNSLLLLLLQHFMVYTTCIILT